MTADLHVKLHQLDEMADVDKVMNPQQTSRSEYGLIRNPGSLLVEIRRLGGGLCYLSII